MKKISLLLAACIVAIAASAQMTFSFSNGVTGETAANPMDGSTTITVPAGTNLSGLITAVQIDGNNVTASEITPNPTTTKIDYGQLEIFTYNNKAYGFRFVEDVWFCAVFISDCHTGQGSNADGTSVADLTNITNNIIAMGRTAYTSTPKVTFSGVEGLPSSFIPKASIVFCTGDLDADKDDHSNFVSATATLYKTAGIPFIFIAGNHDFSPDYWTGENPDRGVTSGGSGGHAADLQTLDVIKTNNNYWNGKGVFDEGITYFTTGNSRAFEPQHFTFKFNDVRFYCANNYWFQKPHSAPGLLSAATYYAPDPIINNLETFVGNHTDEASVWMQHYSFNAGSDIKRWWLDQCDPNYNTYIKTTDSSEYGTNADVELWSNTGGNATEFANKKRDKLASLIEQTTNPVHFSGHSHVFSDMTWTNNDHSTRDYTCGANGRSGNTNNAYVVLLKRGEGVKAVVQTKF